MRTYRELDTVPQKGDLVVFWSDEKNRYSHVGLVIESDGVNFTTIEGNTGPSAGVVDEGDGVYEKYYDIYSEKEPRFVHLDYSLVTTINSGGAGENPYPVEDTFQVTGTAVCTGNGVRVRATPNGTILGSLYEGDRFEVDGNQSGEWVHVKVTGIGIGYMHEDYVSYEDESSSWNKTGIATCTGNGVYVRKTPGGTIIGQLYEGDQFEVDENSKSGEWEHVKVSGVGIGYMHEDYVSYDTEWITTGTRVCTGNGVYVRETPGGEIIGQLYKGDTFEVDGKHSGNWVHVKVDGIGIGYIHSDYCAEFVSEPSASSMIKTAQSALNSYFNLGVEVDGSWGPASKEAFIMAIQIALNDEYGENLDVDGSFGPATQAAVEDHVISRGTKNTYVAVLQIGLLAHGYYLSDGVDGSFGPATEEAVIEFQEDVGILNNGKAGIDTFSHLAGEA